MLRISHKQVSYWLFLLLFTIASGSRAESLQDEVLRLEATIKTLTVQNAELIKENENLRKQMSQAISAKREGKKVVVGCDIESISKKVTFTSDQYRAMQTLENWLKSEGANCTDQQLRQISADLNSWLRSNTGVFSANSQAIIKFLLKSR